MDIKQYIRESEQLYKLRIRTILPVDDDAMDKVEAAVEKYFPATISRPKKTILQTSPIDFPNVASAEVWIIDLVLGIPVSERLVQETVRTALNAPEGYVIVRDPASPMEVNGLRREALADIDAEAEKRGLRPLALLADNDYTESPEIKAEEHFGNQYNAALLGYLAGVEDERRSKHPKFASPLFANLDIPKITSDDTFNDKIDGAPRIRPAIKKEAPKVVDGVGDITRVYLDDKGNKVVLSRRLDGDA